MRPRPQARDAAAPSAIIAEAAAAFARTRRIRARPRAAYPRA